MGKTHRYQVEVQWMGNRGAGTVGYRAYDRAHGIAAEGKPPILGSSDPAFQGDPTRYNPEELFVASLSACHMLWYLHLCATQGIVVTDYCDRPVGVMTETPEGSGRFVEVTLHPVVTITPTSEPALAAQLHEQAHHFCFLANSVNFPVRCDPVIQSSGIP